MGIKKYMSVSKVIKQILRIYISRVTNNGMFFAVFVASKFHKKNLLHYEYVSVKHGVSGKRVTAKKFLLMKKPLHS